jgi:hypothetical protein
VALIKQGWVNQDREKGRFTDAIGKDSCVESCQCQQPRSYCVEAGDWPLFCVPINLQGVTQLERRLEPSVGEEKSEKNKLLEAFWEVL